MEEPISCPAPASAFPPCQVHCVVVAAVMILRCAAADTAWTPPMGVQLAQVLFLALAYLNQPSCP